MKNKLMIYEIFSIIFILFLGVILHFTYKLSNYNVILSIFSSVNESTWEHIKIALTPTLLWGLVDGFLYGQKANYFLAKTTSLITIIILIKNKMIN